MMFGNIMIIGDSYSTFEGYIPKKDTTYYWENRSGTDVRSVGETWWYKLIEETNSKLILNDSWSGSTVCHTGYDGNDTSKTSSFVYRLSEHISKGFFEENQIDTVFVFGGTNDSWANSPLGELKFGDWSNQELFSYLPAICYLICKLKETLPNAHIVCIINSELKQEIIEGTVKACEYYDVQYVKLENIDKIAGHPTVKGMRQIKEQILEKI